MASSVTNGRKYRPLRPILGTGVTNTALHCSWCWSVRNTFGCNVMCSQLLLMVSIYIIQIRHCQYYCDYKVPELILGGNRTI
jgi:hypothetical protein